MILKHVFIIAITVVAMIGMMVPSVFAQFTGSVNESIIFSQIIETFETKENGKMQFEHIGGIAVDKDGKIYAADFGNFRIQIFDAYGVFNSFIAVDGRPHGIEVVEDKVYVAVWGKPIAHEGSHIELFFTNGTKITSFSGPLKPGDIAINNLGNIYVTDYHGSGTIHIFDSSGNLLEILTAPLTLDGKNAILTGITLDNLGNIYVTDYGHDRVMKLDSSGDFLFEFILPLKEQKFEAPNNIQIDSGGNFFVTDRLDRVLILDSSGDFLYSFGEPGNDGGQFMGSHGVTMDNFGRIYTAEWVGSRIQIFNITNSIQSEIYSDVSENYLGLNSTDVIETQINLTSNPKLMCEIGIIGKDGICIVDPSIQTEKIIVEHKSSRGGGCLISTATYGSELATEVQQLRELRDNQLMNTVSGTQFMSTFNNIYYSFSPIVADYERENPLFLEIVKLAITPMISTLSLMENAESESEVLGMGLSVITLNIGMYLGVPAIVIVGIRKRF